MVDPVVSNPSHFFTSFQDIFAAFWGKTCEQADRQWQSALIHVVKKVDHSNKTEQKPAAVCQSLMNI